MADSHLKNELVHNLHIDICRELILKQVKNYGT